MSIILVYIDHSIYADQALKQMLERKLALKNRSIKTIYYLEHNDITLIDTMQSILDDSQEFCIATSAKAYPLVSRILATLNGDTLIATGNTLHPASAAEVRENSFLLRLNSAICNVILLKSTEEIPQILLESKKKGTIWQLFANETQLEKLKHYARDKPYHLDHRQIIQGWYEIILSGQYRAENLLAFFDNLICFPSEDIFDTCIEVFGSKGETISFAESCTGGLIAASFTARSGSSAILKGSVVSYANEIKRQWLQVNSDILDHHGAVSQACVSKMAEGVRELAQSDIALATSGIAGPTGGTALKPVGTVYIAVSNKRETRTKHLLLKGDRNYIQYQALMYTMRLMILLEKKNFEEFFKNT